jgi:hypothetical protein
MAAMIIGTSGAIKSGKSVLADYLVTSRGYEIVNTYQAILDEVVTEFRTTLVAYVTATEHRQVTEEYLRHRLAHDRDMFYRAILQDYGTARRHVDPHYWCKKWRPEIEALLAQDINVAFPGVRYVEEVLLVKSLGGYLVKINRPDSGDQAMKHEVEHGLDSYIAWDLVLDNTLGVEELCGKFETWLKGKGL